MDKVKLLRDALVGVVGSSDECELKGMLANTRTFMAMGSVPYKDGSAMVNAIQAILDTAPRENKEEKQASAQHSQQSICPRCKSVLSTDSGFSVCNNCGFDGAGKLPA